MRSIGSTWTPNHTTRAAWIASPSWKEPSWQLWPTATEVVGAPLTDAIARTLGMQLFILTGKVPSAERAPLAARGSRSCGCLCPSWWTRTSKRSS